METKRCAICQKELRAGSQRCSRCGQPVRPLRRVNQKAQSSSVHLASPHRAGHYVGLHPEDQPYHSSKIHVQRTTRDELDHQSWPLPEPDAILFPATDEALALKAHRLQRHTKEITPAQEIVAPETIRAYRLPRPLLSLKTISLLLSLSCIFFLLASSLIAFALIGHHPFNAIASKPQVTVTSVATHVGQPASTTDGPAVILLFPSELQLMARKGENPHPTQIFITNTGGHTLNWTLGQNSDVNAPLLSVNTASGSLQPGEKATLLVSCVSDKLAPGSYHTELVVSDSSNEAAPAPQMLPVTLWVEESQ